MDHAIKSKRTKSLTEEQRLRKNAAAAVWRANNKERLREINNLRAREYRAKNPRKITEEQRLKRNESNKARWIKNIDYNRARQNARRRRHTAENPEVYRYRSPKAAALLSWMLELKSAPCADCGNTFPTCCMDFDHMDGHTKAYNVGSMFAHQYSRELIESELKKCQLVCSNCHRIRTRDRRKGKKVVRKGDSKLPPVDTLII
jgi:hypothetical protein